MVECENTHGGDEREEEVDTSKWVEDGKGAEGSETAGELSESAE